MGSPFRHFKSSRLGRGELYAPTRGKMWSLLWRLPHLSSESVPIEVEVITGRGGGEEKTGGRYQTRLSSFSKEGLQHSIRCLLEERCFGGKHQYLPSASNHGNLLTENETLPPARDHDRKGSGNL